MAVSNTTEESAAKAKVLRASRFKLGSHYTMERFCATFIAFMLAFACIIGGALHQKVQNSKITLTSQAIYGDGESMFSLTQDIVQIKGLWHNSDNTKAIILLQLPGGMANLSADAHDYKMFMTGVNSTISSTPLGSIYVFGSTGYIALGFTDSAGFKPAAYQIILRNTSYLSDGDKQQAAALHEGDSASFQYYNQLRIVANFAASGASVANFYTKTDYTATDIYNELIQSSLIDDQKAKCDDDVAAINTSMLKANEYARRLEFAGVTMDEPLPMEIFGDSITTSPNQDSVHNFDQDTMMNVTSGGLNSVDGFFSCIDTHDTKAFPEGSKLYFSTSYVFPGGLNYDYQDLTVDDDLVSQFMSSDMSYSQYNEALNDERSTYTVDLSPQFGDYILDGVTVDKDTSSGSGTVDIKTNDVKTNIKNYEDAISDIYSKKQDLQTVELPALLQLYYSSKSMQDMTSIDISSDVLTMF